MKRRSLQAMCLLNFFLADVRDGLGPFLGIFLIDNHWQADQIGLVMTAGGIAGLLATFPAGMLVDATRYKRLLIAAASMLIMVSTVALWFAAIPSVALLSQVITGVAAAVIASSVAGMTLGLAGQKRFPHQMGQNETFNHAGNMTTAIVAGIVSWMWGIGPVFILLAVMAICSMATVMGIRAQDIDHDAARGAEQNGSEEASPSLLTMLKKPALAFTGITLLLFHLANAAQLPMLSMRMASLAQDSTLTPGAFAAITVVISQAVMIPVALLTSRHAAQYGYNKLILTALIVLPIRAAIAVLWDSPLSVIPVQVLDGVAAGILGVATPGIVALMLKGSGHVNAGLGAVTLLQGIGAAISPALAGVIAAHYSYNVAFAALGAIAVVALLVWSAFMSRRLMPTLMTSS